MAGSATADPLRRGSPPAGVARALPHLRGLGRAADDGADHETRRDPQRQHHAPGIDLEKFAILVTAERSARVKDRVGRMVLRGQSPSTRLFPPDLLEFSIGSARRSRLATGSTTWRPLATTPCRLADSGTPLDHRPDAARSHHASRRDGTASRRGAVSAVGRAPPPRARARLSASTTATRCGSRPGWCVGRSRGGAHDVCVQRAVPGPFDRGGPRRRDHGRAHQSPAAADDGALARHPARQSERRHSRPDPAGGPAWRRVHLSAPLSRRRHLLVSPPRSRGHPAGARPLRQPAGAVADGDGLLRRPTARRC